MTTHLEVLTSTLGALSYVEVRSAVYKDAMKQFRLTLRIKDPDPWKSIVEAILREESRSESKAYTAHICKQYLIHDDALHYTWNVVIQVNTAEPQDVVLVLARIIDLVGRYAKAPVSKAVKTPKSRNPRSVSNSANNNKSPASINYGEGLMEGGEVVEMPLVGCSESRNMPQAPIGTPGGSLGRAGGRSSKGAHLMAPQRSR